MPDMKRWQRTLAGILGIAAVALLHSLVFVAEMWGSRVPSYLRTPERVGAGANYGSSTGSSEERMIIVQLQEQVDRKNAPPTGQQSTLVEKLLTPMLVITGPDALPMPPLFPDEQGEESSASQADIIARTQLTGLYEGQIRARIERAWLRPRDVLESERFRCRVLIRQQANGIVREVELQQCNGSWRWQQSLVNAIFSSSPLPAPPNPKVFTDVFSMQFESVAYVQGLPAEMYEGE
jgi:hypothetical protein